MIFKMYMCSKKIVVKQTVVCSFFQCMSSFLLTILQIHSHILILILPSFVVIIDKLKFSIHFYSIFLTLSMVLEAVHFHCRPSYFTTYLCLTTD
jgi:hypothetical protein